MEDEEVVPRKKVRKPMDKFKGSIRGPLRFRASVPKKHQEGNRTVYPPITLNNHEFNKTQDFPENSFYTTKYTLWTFIPKVLYEQFRKATSFYFLIICIITLIPQLSPVNPATSVMGLLFILIVSAIREAYEDYGRLAADTLVNTKPYSMIEEGSGHIIDTLSFRIRVGDLVYLKAGDRIPLDIVVLKTPQDGLCYMETAALDGETNLKQVKAVPLTQGMTREQIAAMQGTVECETPHHRLYNFRGNMSVQGEVEMLSLDEKNLLLMGSTLKNTDWVIGLCVYAGPETKMGLNLKTPPSKFSRLDIGLNTYVFFIFAINFSLCAIMAGMSAWWDSTAVAREFQLGGDLAPALTVIANFLSYFALLNYLIPLSLVVTLECSRFLQAQFMGWDMNMYHDGRQCVAKTSNLNDELALVEYIFSDKTGTLTENLMTFRQCSINGAIYKDGGEGKHSTATSGGLLRALNSATTAHEDQAIRTFLKALAVCHSVQAEKHKETGEIEYKAASPDEEALCKGASENGFIFVDRIQNDMQLSILGTDVTYEILLEIEFTSDRRRMTMVLRDNTGTITMFCKGADSVILERLDPHSEANITYLDATKQHLERFSQIGLRTLLFGTKALTKESWEEFHGRWASASTLIDGRDDALEVLADELERGLTLIGASAIEDKLQDGVPETIANLRKAGIKIWVITGDKQETAINIGYSSKLLTPSMNVLLVNSTDDMELEKMLLNYINRFVEVDEDDKRIMEEWQTRRNEQRANIEDTVLSTIHPLPVNVGQKKRSKPSKIKRRKKKHTKAVSFLNDDDDSDLETPSEDGDSQSTTGSRPISGSFGSDVAYSIPEVSSPGTGEILTYSSLSSGTVSGSYGTMDEGSGPAVPANTPAPSTQSSFRASESSKDGLFSPSASFKVNNKKKIAIVVDGRTLVHILADFREVFMILARNCQSVVCNRVTPLQKAELVKLVSQSEGIISLAIGDGGNDVSMIQEAHIGVGIQGREGSQAARASDFALAQFKHLQRLLTVHGRYCLLRNTKTIYYSIYKNTATFLPQFYYGFFNGFSAQTLYNQWVMMMFNIFLTSVPIFFLGLFEKDLHESIIEQNPQVYQVHKTLKFKSLLRWFLYAVYHSLVIFWFTYATFGPTTTVVGSGRSVGLNEFGFYMMTMAVLVVTLRLALETVHWVFFTHFAVWGSLIFYFLARLALSNMPFLDVSQYGLFGVNLSTPSYWFSVLLVVVTCLVPNFTAKYLNRNYFPKEWYILQEKHPHVSHGTSVLGFFSAATDFDESAHDLDLEAHTPETDERRPLIHLDGRDSV